MSVTGHLTPRFKNVRRDNGSLIFPLREQIKPKAVNFICVNYLYPKIYEFVYISLIKPSCFFLREAGC